MTRSRRRFLGASVLGAGSLLGAVNLTSEWYEIGWWSPVRGIGAGPYQDFIDLYSGELRVGRRGTGGFFNRYIPPAGFMFERISFVKWKNRTWLPGPIRRNQTSGITIPLWPLAALLGAPGAFLRIRMRHRPGHCRACGYDLAGLAAGPCPECGRLAHACASSTSQPG